MEEFYLPCLLDRLTDLNPRQTGESREDRRITLDTYKAKVERDILQLLDSSPLPFHVAPAGTDASADEETRPLTLADFPLCQQSVLNYGVEVFKGSALDADQLREWERTVAETIERFDPRVYNVAVRLLTEEDFPNEAEKGTFRSRTRLGYLAFDIRAALYAEPNPEQLRFMTAWDLKSDRWNAQSIWKSNS